MLARSLKLLVTYEAASQVSEAANFASETVSQARLLRLPAWPLKVPQLDHNDIMPFEVTAPITTHQTTKINQENWGKGTDDHILPLGI